MKVIDLGVISYHDAYLLQKQRLEEVIQGAENTLYLLEHPPVITFGRNGGAEFLHIAPEQLAKQGVEVIKSTRGGSITCHFPGQLVGYPIIRVNRQLGGLRGFFYRMEEAVLRTLAEFGLQATRQKGRPGVWIDNRKICSTGVALSHWVSQHGFSLNITRNLDLFNAITLCGLPDAEATSLHKELNSETITMQEVKHVCSRHFTTLFTDSSLA